MKNKKNKLLQNSQKKTIKILIFSSISLIIALLFPKIINIILQNTIIKAMLSIVVVITCTLACFEYLYQFIMGKKFCGIIALLPWSRKQKTIQYGFETSIDILNKFGEKIGKVKRRMKNMEKFKEKWNSFSKFVKLQWKPLLLQVVAIISLVLTIISAIESAGVIFIVNGTNIIPLIGIALTFTSTILMAFTKPISTNGKAQTIIEAIIAFNAKLKEEKAKQKAIDKAEFDKKVKYEKALALVEQKKLEAQQKIEKENEEKELLELASKIEEENRLNEFNGNIAIEKPVDEVTKI